MGFRVGYRCGRAPLLVSTICMAGLMAFALSAPNARAASDAGTSNPATSRTIGLALTDWRYALYETDYGKEECPDGVQPGERKQFEAMKDLGDHLTKVGGNYQTRGPNGETGDNNPLLVEDPIPFHELKTTKG